MSEQLDALRKKLNSAVSQRQTIENTRQEQVRTLAQFIAKLSLVCKGMDIELDNRLAAFRKLLHKGANYQDLLPVIDELTDLLSRHEANLEARFRALHQGVQAAGVNLQKRKGIPAELRRTLRHLLNTELVDAQTAVDFLPILERLVTIYDQVMASRSQQGDDVPSDNTQLQPLIDELNALSSEISLEGELAEHLRQLKSQINAASTIDNLLNASVEIMRVIVLSLSKERQSAQHFLAALNHNLSELQQAIAKTSDRSKQLDSKISAVYRQIDENINHLSEQTAQATDIQTLKETVESKLSALTEQLLSKEKLEAQQRDTLSQALHSMQSQVEALEQQVAQYETKLERQRLVSLQDGLTKLPNRIAFDERIDLELKHFKRHQTPLCLVVIDVDHFKSINDNYGHSAGDKTLQVLATAMKKSIRSTDFIARFGGEEFVMLMPNVSIDNVVRPLEKLRHTIRSIPFKFKNEQVQITVSMGVTQINADDTALSAFDRADKALYEAKNAGRDRLILSS
ncbi:GGDEF domain-containing protein [Pseudoalteromonas ruthenica]|uniref:GGDEF domain-containing protein n=1 Tax=Pseudoalteromonas ruthenica TaxID=151081 RepID=UPI00241D37E8|nr:GGDEF domain-containing protein [Pseudoalteromonas ruthenica]